MGSRSRTSTTTERQVIEQLRGEFERLSTREAQVLRMRHGIAESGDVAVAEPPHGSGSALKARLAAIEQEIRDRLRTAGEPSPAKSKIIDKLKDSD